MNYGLGGRLGGEVTTRMVGTWNDNVDIPDHRTLDKRNDDNDHWKPRTVVVTQLEAMICLWTSSLRRHANESTEHSEPGHNRWIIGTLHTKRVERPR